jgi:hypothetical protein
MDSVRRGLAGATAPRRLCGESQARGGARPAIEGVQMIDFDHLVK